MPDAGLRRYRFQNCCLDTQTRELRLGNGSAVPLTAKAFETLHYLIQYRQRVVGKDELLAAVWPGRVVEENNLTQAISAVRRALGSGAGEHRYIITVPGRGYRFIAEVQEEGEDETSTGLVDASAPSNTTSTPATFAATTTTTTAAAWRRAIAFGALLFMLALFAAAAWRLREAPANNPVQTSAPHAATLAVLPFRSLSPGPRDELLELGLAETLIAQLSETSPLQVRSLAVTQRFADHDRGPVDAGQQLGATYVIEGSTQRRDDRVRVNARCSRCPTAERCGPVPSTSIPRACSPCRTRSPPR